MAVVPAGACHVPELPVHKSDALPADTHGPDQLSSGRSSTGSDQLSRPSTSPTLLGRPSPHKARHKVDFDESVEQAAGSAAESEEENARRFECSPKSSIPSGLSRLTGLRSESSVRAAGGELRDNYEVARMHLGKGSFGTVREAACRKTQHKCAVKSIRRDADEISAIEMEIAISKKLKHPNLVRIFETYQDDVCIHIVMELCSGGSLSVYVARHRENIGFNAWSYFGPPVREVAQFLWQMLAGVAYLHHHRIAHRDIKSDNYLLESKAPGALLKLVDFGFATRYSKGEVLHELLGTLDFVAPEVLSGAYTEKCDIWSIGAVTYLLFTGAMPFGSCKDDDELVKRIRAQAVVYDKNWWSGYPSQAKAAVAELLTRDPAERPSAKELLITSTWLGREGRPGAAENCCCSVS